MCPYVFERNALSASEDVYVMKFVSSGASGGPYIRPNLSYFVTGWVVGRRCFVVVFGCSMTEYSL